MSRLFTLIHSVYAIFTGKITKMNIYDELPHPFFVLAPMDDVTDTVFRRIITGASESCGIIAGTAKPDLFFTEFVNADGFCSVGREKVSQKLKFTPEEQPLIAQIWGLKPENFTTLTKYIKRAGFAGVDINMGCPEKTVVRKGACAALINNEQLAGEIITAVQKAAGKNLPVSVKTRLGYKTVDTERWISFLLGFKLAASTIHLRTAVQMSKAPAQYDELTKIVELRDKISPETKIIANGDILSREQGEELVKKYGIDGVMIGRGIFHNPLVFSMNRATSKNTELISLLVHHIKLHEKTWTGEKCYPPLKKYFKIYVSGFDGAADLREKLMATNSHQEALEVLALNYRNSVRQC